MASYVFSTNPNVVFQTTDLLSVNTTSAASLSVFQQGSEVILTNGVNTATLRGILLEQLATSNVTFTDGSVLLIGDNTTGAAADSAANTLTGTALNDQLIGLAGNDILDGGAGSDRIYGNQGEDNITSAASTAGGNDTVYGGKGNDVINYANATASGNQLIYGNLENDAITGSSGNDTVFGGQGNDTVSGGPGNDRVYGNLGDDSIVGGAGNNLIYGNQGSDRIVGSAGGNDTVFGGMDGDNINYSSLLAADVSLIYGNRGDDILIGGAGKDTLYGGKENDDLTGNLGADSLFGNLGNDTFTYNNVTTTVANNDSGVTTATADVVNDFVSGQDKVRVFLAGVDTPGTSSNYREYADATVTTVELAVTSFAGRPGSTPYTFVAGATDGYLVIDVGTNGTVDSVIVLKGLNAQSLFDSADIT